MDRSEHSSLMNYTAAEEIHFIAQSKTVRRHPPIYRRVPPCAAHSQIPVESSKNPVPLIDPEPGLS
ncbi:hypothetical protein [Paracoccus jeotgali]|uniref:hypothetical protein n=1 Tax=Paracoccus jeotgali TaxID=2065379 RepID=UPI0013159BC1|nr:hypothetical protein [Paracoccus jeotgali]